MNKRSAPSTEKAQARPLTAREEMIQRANGEALALLAKILPLDIEAAAEYLRQNQQSAEAVVSLPFIYGQLAVKARASAIARLPRKQKNLVDLVEESGCETFTDLWREQMPLRDAWRAAKGEGRSGILTVDHDPGPLRNAFTKLRARRAKKSP